MKKLSYTEANMKNHQIITTEDFGTRTC